MTTVYSILQKRESCKNGLLWPVRRNPAAAVAAEPGPGPGSQLPARGPRCASGYPGAGVSRPIGARGDSAQTAVPGDRSSDVMGNTFLSSGFTPVLCTCGGYGGSFCFGFFFFFNLSCSSKTRVPLNWASTVYLSPESGYREVNKRAREG